MTPTPTTATQLQSIEAKARRLLKRLEIESAPVPVERIARALSVTVRREPLEGEREVSGALYRGDGGAIIGLNSLDSLVRQRFTIAHELGHLILHAAPFFIDRHFLLEQPPHQPGAKRHFLRNKVSSEASDPREIEANRFAACLLMPRDFLMKDFEEAEFPIGSLQLRGLARRYQVSEQAMSYRLRNLGVPLDTV